MTDRWHQKDEVRHVHGGAMGVAFDKANPIGNSPPVPRFHGLGVQVWAQLRIDDIIVHGISGCRADRKCARPCRSVLATEIAMGDRFPSVWTI